MSEQENAELTYGEKAVGLKFNPSGDDAVTNIKKAFAAAIDLIQEERAKDTTPSEKGAMLTLAIREAQSSQMWAVKATTWEG
ncbi:MAG TPA: hypothetical protein VLH38_00475 [Patescibacteria group bacterium]|nr:hypothetical protein [Patescibacteria group bacterium]